MVIRLTKVKNPVFGDKTKGGKWTLWIEQLTCIDCSVGIIVKEISSNRLNRIIFILALSPEI